MWTCEDGWWSEGWTTRVMLVGVMVTTTTAITTTSTIAATTAATIIIIVIITTITTCNVRDFDCMGDSQSRWSVLLIILL